MFPDDPNSYRFPGSGIDHQRTFELNHPLSIPIMTSGLFDRYFALRVSESALNQSQCDNPDPPSTGRPFS
jgi:hypothetical protein